MSVILRIAFPAGRYHATPWGRHVNEGVAEWPPSPWRLLRALIAVWKRTLPELTTDQVHSVLEPLTAPPVFRLPPHRVAHTRHYMPWEKKGPDDRTLVFDTFVAVDRGDVQPDARQNADHTLLVGWLGANLDEAQRAVLGRLAGNLTSLGRAESWVTAELLPDADSMWDSAGWNCVPSSTDPNPVSVFCPDPESCFADTHYPQLDPKKLAKGKVKPADYLFDCPSWHLCLDTESIHSQRWPLVPGSKWINYERPTEAAHRPPRSDMRRNQSRPTIAHFLLDGPVLPLVTDTLVVGEAFRRAAMNRFESFCKRAPQKFDRYRRIDAPERFSSPQLSGKDLDGTRLSGPGHAHYIPLPLESDPRRIGSLVVYARDGFNPDETAVLTGLSWLNVPTLDKDRPASNSARDDTNGSSSRRGRERADLNVALIGLGREFPTTPSLSNCSDEWISLTPFLGHESIGTRGRSRYLRKGLRREWRRFVDKQSDVQSQLRRIDLLNVTEVPRSELQVQSFEFRRNRRKDAGRTASRAAGMFHLKFSESIPGPLMLGYGCHFGMGLFIPADRHPDTST